MFGVCVSSDSSGTRRLLSSPSLSLSAFALPDPLCRGRAAHWVRQTPALFVVGGVVNRTGRSLSRAPSDASYPRPPPSPAWSVSSWRVWRCRRGFWGVWWDVTLLTLLVAVGFVKHLLVDSGNGNRYRRGCEDVTNLVPAGTSLSRRELQIGTTPCP